ncbi:monooxygenase [Hysterangium stoloniferum]|nr:monooxygenase [Hysterangium stoloniferum]
MSTVSIADSAKPTAVISGGSLSGLMAAIVLKNLGYNVTVFERSLTVESQGAGIVLGRWSSKFFDVFDETATEISVPARRRQFFNMDGSYMLEEDIDLRMSSWDKLYYVLRANYDGHVQDGYINTTLSTGAAKGNHGNHATYFMGKTVISHSYDSESKRVVVIVRGKEGEQSQISTDLFVCAEGASSFSREVYFPKLPRAYSGYLAFRGLVPETDVEAETAKVLVNSLSFIHAKDSQFLCYVIPGPRGSTAVGERHINFVWYNTFPDGPGLDKVLTDKDGKRRPFSVTAGSMPQSVVEEEIHPRARAKLSPQCLEVVLKTRHPFVQVVTDVISPSAVFHDGHVILIGDALSGARPHTTANQAADHALRLHAVLQHDPRNLGCLKATWEPESLRYAKYLWDIGAAIGDLSQFGEHPMRADIHKELHERHIEAWMKVGEPK